MSGRKEGTDGRKEGGRKGHTYTHTQNIITGIHRSVLHILMLYTVFYTAS